MTTAKSTSRHVVVTDDAGLTDGIEVILDAIDPATTRAEDASDLRAIADAVDRVAAAEEEIAALVAAARTNGKSWGKIAVALGTSRQSAHERYTRLATVQSLVSHGLPQETADSAADYENKRRAGN